MYALRDVTGSVDCIPLIASSVMSKKLAAGTDAILLDVTVGSGAFMKTKEEATELAKTMVDIGTTAGKRTVALITNMDAPVGNAVGNALEVEEAVEVLKGRGPKDLREICIALASDMLYLCGKGELSECRKMAEESLKDGSAYRKLLDMVKAQGGDISVLEDTSLLPKASVTEELKAEKDAYLGALNAEMVGVASMQLGAGREKLGDTLDMAAGIYLHKKPGDFVKKGETYMTLHTKEAARLAAAKETIGAAVSWADKAPALLPEVLARVEKDKVEMFE
jgi:pyrimidine-nucleoside phosphorylase